MNATKIYVIMHELVRIFLVSGITIAAIYFNKWGLMWFYLLPVFMSLEVKSTNNEERIEK